VAYLASLGSAEPVEPPNTDAPRRGCERCSGDGVSRVVLTPTAELSANARALFKGAKQNAKGEIEVETYDQLAAADQLNKLQSAYVSRSLSGNIDLNGMIGAAGNVSAEQALALFSAFDASS
jgi:hypothetical protein